MRFVVFAYVLVESSLVMWETCSMAHFGNMLKKKVVESSTISEFAKAAGISISTAFAWFYDPKPHGHASTYAAIARALKTTTESLDEEWKSAKAKPKAETGGGRGIPILSEVPAGRGDDDPVNLGLDNGVGTEYINRSAAQGLTDPQAYALIVRGDSMAPRLMPGMTIICSPSAEHVSGRIYAIRFGIERDHECTVKRVFDHGDKLLLSPDNPAQKPYEVDKEHVVRMDMVTHVFGEVQ